MQITYRTLVKGDKDIVVAFIDTEGLDLGIDTCLIPLDQETDVIESGDVYSDEENDETDETVENEQDEENILPVTTDDGPFNLNALYFRVETYQKLTENPEAVWYPLLLPANRFLHTLSENDQRQLCLFFITTRKLIDRELSGNAITDIATQLGNEIYDIAVAMHLPKKLLNYVKSHSGIPIPDLSYAGQNAGRDTEDMTFGSEEYHILMAISVLCKILFPVWGDLIERTRGDVDNMMKETQCINVIESMLMLEPFHAVRNKLYNYVSNLVTNEMKNSYATAAFTATMGGVSKSLFHHIAFSTLIVKRFVTIDLYIPSGNMMVWVSACAKSAFRSLQQNLNKHCRIMPRTDVSESSEYGDDERSVSVLEHSSRITDVTADVPQLLRFGVRMSIPRLCHEYGISELEFRQVVGYYQQNPIQVTVFNKILVGVFVGNQIGGAQGLKYLDLSLYTQLVAITQIYIANNFAASSVVHLLTATTPDAEKPVIELAGINAVIIQNIKRSREYARCEALFPMVVDGVSVASTLKRIQEYIIKYPHYANTATYISAIMDQHTIEPGKLIHYESDVMQQCCEIILSRVNPREIYPEEVRSQSIGV